MYSMGRSIDERYGEKNMGRGVRGVIKERTCWKGMVGYEGGRSCCL